MKRLSLSAWGLAPVASILLGASALAAQPDPAALDPAVNTSPQSPAQPPAPSQTQPASPPAAKPAAPSQAAPAQKPAPAPATSTTQPSAAKSPDARAANPPRSGGNARDRLELEATQITGNRELPRVMYVVPWKKSDLGDLGGRPANSLLDEVLTPVDRDVFLRQNRYYDALKPDAKEGGGAAPAN